MNELVIVDYIGNCTNEKIPTGHALKTLNESGEMLGDVFDVEYIVNEVYKNYLPADRIKKGIPYVSCPMNQNTLLKKIMLRVRKIKSIWNITNSEKNIWFINTDFWLFVALLIYPLKKKNRIFVTNYIDYYHDGGIGKKIKNAIYRLSCRNIDCVFTTDKTVELPKHQYIPDYWYDENKYREFNCTEKRNAVYICGGINPGKDIMGAIDAFNVNGFPLHINGFFSNEQLYEKAITCAKDNITIHDGRMSDEEYYINLGKYKFVLLPYKKENYSNRSSGVILEAIFLGAIVIAPEFLLKHLGIEGISYGDIKELRKFDLTNISDEVVKKLKEFNSKVLEDYRFETIKKRYVWRLDEINDNIRNK